MKTTIETQQIIQAPISKVWQILTRFEDYPKWSQFIKEFYGNPTVGSRTGVLLSPPGGKSMKMNPVFLKIDKERELRWRGSLIVKGIFDGEHYFILQKINENSTKLIQGENFSGILVPLLKKMIMGSTLKGFEQFNQAIKERAEQGL